jgi:hypothetical protein
MKVSMTEDSIKKKILIKLCVAFTHFEYIAFKSIVERSTRPINVAANKRK